MIIDTHAHLIYERMNTEEIIKNMKQEGLEKIITIGTDVKDSYLCQELAEKNENIYATVGIHPEYASNVTQEDLKRIDYLANKNKIVGIGEIGLDYHYTKENIEKQKEIFLEQIKLAYKHNLPICIHSRDAKEDTYEILNKNKEYLKNSGVMHCYSYNSEDVKKFVELGLYISFAGNFTYKKYDIKSVKNIPLDKILVETDSPFLSPVPFRGEANEPKMVKYTLQKIADELEMEVEKLEKQILENTYRLFTKMKR